jgi:hypothetical protein
MQLDKHAILKQDAEFQWLSRPCHTVKDKDTPLRKAVILKENILFRGLTGGEALAKHMIIFEAGVIPRDMLPARSGFSHHGRNGRRRR